MRGSGEYTVRLRLYCRPDGYTWAGVNWGSNSISAQGTELKNESGETYVTGHTADVQFDDGEAKRETWWWSSNNYSRVRQAYSRGAHPGFIQQLRDADTLTVWANSESGTVKVDFDVRNLNYALSQQPEHCREPDAYSKWVWDEWETRSGKASYSITLYSEKADDIYLDIYCRGDQTDHRAALVDWGNRRPYVADDTFEIRQTDGSLHSSSHTARVRYGHGTPQSESWQLFSPEITARNRSLLGGFVGDSVGKIARFRQVDTVTIWTDAGSDTIEAEFDVRRLDKALARMDRHCK